MTYLGVEYGAVFHLEGPNGQTAVFNDSTDPNFVGILDPESSGLDAPEIREDSNDRVESDGAIFGDFFAGKRPIVLQGRIIASSKNQRAERIGKLRAASNAKTEDATLWWEDPLGGKVFVNVRRQQPLRITKGWTKEFQLALVSADSRILSYAPKVVTDKGISTSSQEKFPGNTGDLFIGKDPSKASEWKSVANAKASDNAYATVVVSAGATAELELVGVVTSNMLWGNTYGFSVPSTAIVTGIEVKPELKASTASKTWLQTAFVGLNISAGGDSFKNTKTGFPFAYLTTADATTVVGAASDPWTLYSQVTPAAINSSKFGAGIAVSFNAAAVTVSADAVPIKVTYVEPLEVTATNDGDAPAPAIIKVKGPLENFYVFNQTTGEILTYTGKVESGKEIWFDTQNVTVTERGTGITEPINQFANVGLPNDWVRVSPGANKILVAGLGGNANTELIVEYRNAWE